MPLTEDDLADLLTIEQAATILGRSRATVYRIIADRKIDIVRMGSGRGRVFMTRRALLDYANRGVVRADRPTRGRRPAA
jgi:excisionase family DNA binding protein